MSNKWGKAALGFAHGALSGYDAVLKEKRAEAYQNRIEEARMERQKSMAQWTEQEINAPIRADERAYQETVLKDSREWEENPERLSNIREDKRIGLLEEQNKLQRDKFAHEQKHDAEPLALKREELERTEKSNPGLKHAREQANLVQKKIMEDLGIVTGSELIQLADQSGVDPEMYRLRDGSPDEKGLKVAIAQAYADEYYLSIATRDPRIAAKFAPGEVIAEGREPTPTSTPNPDAIVTGILSYNPNTKDPEEKKAAERVKEAFNKLSEQQQQQVLRMAEQKKTKVDQRSFGFYDLPSKPTKKKEKEELNIPNWLK